MDFSENLHRYGTNLEPIEKDVPCKRVAVEDQIVTDENGKRRFHGAFTGGFSAGFWNSVGSLEGWTPQNFKSSRKNRATNREMCPQDFMDSEDISEFGIAPRVIRPRSQFSKANEPLNFERLQSVKHSVNGIDILNHLVEPFSAKVAINILKRMGWKSECLRSTPIPEKKGGTRRQFEEYLIQKYGCGEEEGLKIRNCEDTENCGITFSSNDYEPSLRISKNNRYGLSYTGLSRRLILSGSESFSFGNKNCPDRPQISDKTERLQRQMITGQAFGVGALEEDDEDVYALDDLSQYDFSLESNYPKAKQQKAAGKLNNDNDFVESILEATSGKSYKIDLPRHFIPRDWAQRKSRFAPKGNDLMPHATSLEQRASLLGEEKNCLKILQISKTRKIADNSPSFLQNFVSEPQGFPESSLSLNLTKAVCTRTGTYDDKCTKIPLLLREAFISDKFTSGTIEGAHAINEIKANLEGKQVIVERSTFKWIPKSQLCKRYNISVPLVNDLLNEQQLQKPNPKLSVFNCLNRQVLCPYAKTAKSLKSCNNFLVNLDCKKTTAVANVLKVSEQKIPVIKPSEKELTDQHKILDWDKDVTQKPITENLDLFRAVFGESDEECDDKFLKETEIITENINLEDLTKIKIKLGLPTTEAAESTEESRSLRNNSPPRGIFSTLSEFNSKLTQADLTTILEATLESRKSCDKSAEEVSKSTEVYGPILPKNLEVINNIYMKNTNDRNGLDGSKHRAVSKNKYGRVEFQAIGAEIWVEKKDNRKGNKISLSKNKLISHKLKRQKSKSREKKKKHKKL